MPLTSIAIPESWIRAGSGLKPKKETTTAVQFPTMTTTQRDALTPVNGMVIFNSTTATIQKYESGVWGDFGGGGYSTFLALTDTPSSYASQAGKAVVVNAGATALEFVSAVQEFDGGNFSDTYVNAVGFDAGAF